MTLKHLIKLLQDLDQNSDVEDFEIRIDSQIITIKSVKIDLETKIFKRPQING